MPLPFDEEGRGGRLKKGKKEGKGETKGKGGNRASGLIIISSNALNQTVGCCRSNRNKEKEQKTKSLHLVVVLRRRRKGDRMKGKVG